MTRNHQTRMRHAGPRAAPPFARPTEPADPAHALAAIEPPPPGRICNQNGQKIGAKGTRTRHRLIEATIGLLETVGLRDATVAQVAKVAGTSSATFYVYFDGVADVVLAALEHAGQVTPEMEAILAADLSGPTGIDRARRFVECYVAQWQRHRTVFRVRNMAGEEGDARFVAARYRQIRPLLDALAAKIAAARSGASQPMPVAPKAIAGTVLIMLERLGAVAPLMPTADGPGAADMIAAAAWFLHSALVPCPGLRPLAERPFEACACPVVDFERERALARG